MDTRDKTVSPDRLQALVSEGEWSVVAGAFDPLTAEQVKRITAAASVKPKLAVIIESGISQSVLPADARAILVAALRCVDAVALMESAPALLGNTHVERDADDETARTQAFIDLIHSRQEGATR